MKMLMILAASRLLTAIDDSSRAMSDSVMVSREASKTMLLVAPAAWTKLVTAKSIRLGISNGSQIWKYVRIHPAPDTLAASSMSAPTWTNTPFIILTPVVLPWRITTMISAQIVPKRKSSTGVLRNNHRSPSPARMPGMAPEHQIMRSSASWPGKRVRTRM